MSYYSYHNHSFAPVAKIKPKTQKAKGVMKSLRYLVHEFKSGKLGGFMRHTDHVFIGEEKDIKQKEITFPCFARPCPKSPKHGFVDSRVIHSRKELRALWKEVKKYDKAGEIILGPYFDKVKYNAIYVSSGTLSIGKGHDGATGGKKSISFPVAPDAFNKTSYSKSGIKAKDSIYLEAILSPAASYSNWNPRWNLVQARGGPAINSAMADYVPKRTVVTKVIKPHDDLIKWEKDVQSFAKGTVVYGAGHSLASHAAVHCILHKVPFITTEKPKVGSILQPTENRKRKVILKRSDFRRGVQAGINYCKTATVSEMRSMFVFTLSVLHNWAYLKRSEHAAWLLGSAMAFFSKMCTALALGESRHCGNSTLSSDRDNVYVRGLSEKDSHLMLPETFRFFYNEDWEGGFGGLPWATCTWYSLQMWKCLIKYHNRSDKGQLKSSEVAEMMSLINRVVNLAHNGGWWFNKISVKEDMDFAADNPGLAAFGTAEVFADLYHKYRMVKKIHNFKPLGGFYSPCRLDKNGNLIWVKATAEVEYNENYYQWDAKPKIKQIKKVILEARREDGATKTKRIKPTAAEAKALRRKLTRANLNPYDCDFNKDVVFAVGKDGKFAIPGGKRRSVKTTFGVFKQKKKKAS